MESDEDIDDTMTVPPPQPTNNKKASVSWYCLFKSNFRQLIFVSKIKYANPFQL